MKEVTHEKWMENPIPRLMWVWNNDKDLKAKQKVVYVGKHNFRAYPVLVVTNNEANYESFQHCAEIEKPRRMTNKELAHWLREKPTREYRFKNGDFVYGEKNYRETVQDKEVTDDIFIREDDGDWREPLVEVEE